MNTGAGKVHKGSCRCGQVEFQANCAPLITMACHCRGCQKMTASAYSLSSLFPMNSFEVIEGEPVIGGMHGDDRHYFCPHCMSWLYTRPNGLDDLVNVRSTLMDDAKSYEPFIETYTSEMLSWARTPAIHSFKTLPPMDDFPDLLAEFANWYAKSQ